MKNFHALSYMYIFALRNPNFKSNSMTVSLYQLYFKAYCVNKGNLHLSYVLEDGLLVKYLVITQKKSKLKILHRNICLSKKEVYRKLPVQNDRLDRWWLRL